MMKFIYDDPRTREHLIRKLGKARMALAGFFFHDRGASLQKSFLGLLRAILLQILEKFPDLVDIAIPTYKKYIWKNEIDKWQRADLERVLKDVVSQEKIACHLCLFIDGLDEFEGNLMHIADFFKGLSGGSKTCKMKIKACVSSRPLNVFEDAFGQGPGFPIHKWTEADIMQYTTTKFQSNPLMRRISFYGGKSDTDELTRLVIQRAAGVFLWVRLVLDDLLQGLSDGNTLSELQQRLLALPEDIEGLYIRMMAPDRVDPRYLKDAALYFKIVEITKSPLSLYNFSVAMKRPYECILRPVGVIGMADLVRDCALAERRIKSSSGGLLEVVSSIDTDDIHMLKSDHGHKEVRTRFLYYSKTKQTVQYLHQTVKELLRREENWVGIFGPIDISEVRNEALIRLAAICLCRLKDGQDALWYYVIDDLVDYARQTRHLPGGSFVDILDEVNIVLGNISKTEEFGLTTADGHWTQRYWQKRSIVHHPTWHDTFLSFAIDKDIFGYVEAKIRLDSPKKVGRPLLHYAIGRRLDYCPPMNPEMVKLLLNSNEDPNFVFDGESAWQIFLQNLKITSSLDGYWAITADFLSHGADLNVPIGPPHSFPLHLLIAKFAESNEDQFATLLGDLIKKGCNLKHRNSAGTSILERLNKYPVLWRQTKVSVRQRKASSHPKVEVPPGNLVLLDPRTDSTLMSNRPRTHASCLNCFGRRNKA